MRDATIALLISSCIVAGAPALGALREDAAPPAGVGAGGAPSAEVTSAINEFSLKLYAHLRAEPGNLVCSPFSTSTVLAMTMAGARGETWAEMSRALCLVDRGEAVPKQFGALLESLRALSTGEGVELSLANRIWAQHRMAILPEFRTVAKRSFGSDVGGVDFRGDPESARLAINHWVEEQTHQKIQDLFPRGLIEPETRMVLVNAVYFLATWEHPFSEQVTDEAPFTPAGGAPVDVPMMRQRIRLRLADGERFQLLEMPYRGGQLAMVIVLPKAVDGLADVESELDPASLDTALASLSAREVDVMLPRFRLLSQFDLVPPLQSMGMVRAFTDCADFSGIGPTPTQISSVVQKAFVEVNERGTEAAAATGVVQFAGETRVAIPFHADHPFLFIIRDRPTGAILFLGRVADPST